MLHATNQTFNNGYNPTFGIGELTGGHGKSLYMIFWFFFLDHVIMVIQIQCMWMPASVKNSSLLCSMLEDYFTWRMPWI